MPTTVTPLFTKYSKLSLGDATATMTDFQCSSTSIGITSEGGGTTSLNTLCPSGSFSEVNPSTYNLSVTLAQDIENKDSFLMWLLIHDNEQVDFTYYPKTDAAGNPVGYGFKGKVTVNAPDTIGGTESGNFATATVTLPLVGKYSVVDGTGAVLPELDAMNISKASADFVAAAGMTDLTTLGADATQGDGSFGGRAMKSGEYIVLVDKSKAHYAAAAWAVGAMP